MTNLLRVLSLPEQVQQMVEGGAISTGHARALLALNDTQQSLRLANETVAQALSVRELERRVRELIKPEITSATSGKATSAPGGKPTPTDPGVRRIEDDFASLSADGRRVHPQWVGPGTDRSIVLSRTTTWIEYLTSSCGNADRITSTIVSR